MKESYRWTKQGDPLGPGCILVYFLEDPNCKSQNCKERQTYIYTKIKLNTVKGRPKLRIYL